MNRKYRLIKNLFKDKMKRADAGAISEIGCVEQRMKDQWKENTEKVDPKIGEQIWARILKEYKMEVRKRYFLKLRQPLIAACFTLALLVGGYLLYINIGSQECVKIIAKTDTVYILPDSSEVWMQPESSICFPKDFTKNRTVQLKGSSLFNVRKRGGSKFCVQMDKAYIEVKGTKFLVERLDNGKDEITLFHGCVSFNVETTKEEIIMQPLQQLLFDSKDSKIETRKIENIEWENGKFAFNAMPLKQLLHIINQMYHTDIIFEGTGVESLFSGTIRQDESLEDVVNKICFIMNLHMEKESGRIIISN